MSLKALHRQTGSIIDYTLWISAENVESITLHILEDMIDVVLECGFESAEEAYQKINETSDLISWVLDTEGQGVSDEYPLSVVSHESFIFEHLLHLADHSLATEHNIP